MAPIDIIEFMNLSSIDLNLLTAFDALMEHRQVTRAGKAVGLSQPAMSNALGRLRLLFADQLLVRSSNGMEPTPRALELHEPIRRVLRELELTIGGGTAFVEADAIRTFTIAMAEDAAFLLLPRIKSRLNQIAPGISLKVLSTAYMPGIDLVSSGEAEFSIGLRPTDTPSHIASEVLFDEHLVCLARCGHPAFGKSITAEDYLAYPHISFLPSAQSSSRVDLALEATGDKRRVAVNVPHMLLIPFLLPGTDLIGNLSKRIADYFAPIAGLDVGEIPFDMGPYQAHLAWHIRLEDEPGHRWLRHLIIEEAQSL